MEEEMVVEREGAQEVAAEVAMVEAKEEEAMGVVGQEEVTVVVG